MGRKSTLQLAQKIGDTGRLMQKNLFCQSYDQYLNGQWNFYLHMTWNRQTNGFLSKIEAFLNLT